MKCRQCGRENRADAGFCDECGAELEASCPGCREPNRLEAKFCRKCGQSLSLEHVLKPMSLLIRDEPTGELEHREVVGRDALPAHQQPPEAVVPTVGALDDPAPGFPPHASEERGLAASSDVRDDSPTAHGGFRIGVVIALVQAQMLRASWATRGAEDDRVEHVGHHPLVVHVGAGDEHGQGHAAPIRKDVTFHPEFRAIRRVRPRGAPPLGALAMALSRDAKSHLMPRCLS